MSTETNSVRQDFRTIGQMVRVRLKQPVTWAHVIAVNLDRARRDSTYGKEPLLIELRREVQHRLLDRVRPIETGLTDADLEEGAACLDESSTPDSQALPIQDRTLAWMADPHSEVDDWTLRGWHQLLAEPEFGLVADHFAGRRLWASAPKTREPAAAPPRSWREELDALVGLAEVKAEVGRLRDFLRVRKLRQARGWRTEGFTLHQVFLGNPGTGKTSVARILARIYQEMGFLSKGELIETDRSGLVGQYIGATEFKTEAVIRSALGSVLFIDEAYSLAGGGPEDFGPRAVDILVKMMEDHRNNLVIIVAGYTEEMAKFIESNAGLASRFTRFIQFPDYTDAELREILNRIAGKESFTLPDPIAERAGATLAQRRQRLGKRFGNAREVRNLWEQVLMRQASRLCEAFGEADIPDDALRSLTPDDLPELPTT